MNPPLAVSSSESITAAIPITQTEEEKDKQFSHEIAKRSVARAALHLGITSMSSEALDVMGDALITFLERLGGYIAESAECAGRSSSHCNVLDGLQAVECMSGNIISTETSFGNKSSNSYAMGANGNNYDNQTAWEALAAFGYGPSWRQKHDAVTAPNSTTNNNNDDENAHGWNAPYLDVIPNYPLRRDGDWKSTHYKALEEEACATSHDKNDKKDKDETSQRAEKRLNNVLNSMPDVFWGSEIPMKEDQDKKEKEEVSTPPTKRVKLSIPNEIKHPSTSTAERPAYLPSFLPSFPPFYTYQHPSSQAKHPTQQQRYLQTGSSNTIDSSTNVRRSLVQLYQSSHDASTNQTGNNEVTTENHSLVVPSGVDGDASKEKGNGTAVTALTKASGSRIPRILEGSMDTVPC